MKKSNKEKPIDISLSRVKLTKLESQVSSLPNYPEKAIFQREIEKAWKYLENDDPDYSNALWREIRHTVCRLKIRSFIVPSSSNSNIQLILTGIITYAIIVFFIGICAVIVYAYDLKPEPWLVKFVKMIGLDPLFRTVLELGIKPTSYVWGILGGAGAVVSMVKRFDVIAEEKTSEWLLFSQGLFNPIVGSLSAVVACQLVSIGLVPEFQGIPLMVISFFSGFSERLLSKIGSSFQEKTK